VDIEHPKPLIDTSPMPRRDFALSSPSKDGLLSEDLSEAEKSNLFPENEVEVAEGDSRIGRSGTVSDDGSTKMERPGSSPNNKAKGMGRKQEAANEEEEHEASDADLEEPIDEKLFRVKPGRSDDEFGCLLPAPFKNMSTETAEEQTLNLGATVPLQQIIAERSLGERFRDSVAQAWEPSNIQALIDSKKVQTQPGLAEVSDSEDAAMISTLLGGLETTSGENLSSVLRQKHALSRRDRYRRRLQARGTRSAPGNRKWSQRVDACKHSLRGLNALSSFAEYVCHPRHQLATAPAVA
jgi:hypothetical protein